MVCENCMNQIHIKNPLNFKNDPVTYSKFHNYSQRLEISHKLATLFKNSTIKMAYFYAVHLAVHIEKKRRNNKLSPPIGHHVLVNISVTSFQLNCLGNNVFIYTSFYDFNVIAKCVQIKIRDRFDKIIDIS